MRWLDMLAVALYVLDVTGSALMVAMMVFLRMLPMFLFGAVAGAFAETVDRRIFLIVSLLLLAAVYAVLFWLAWTERLQLWQLGISVFLSGIIWALELSVRRTMIAEIAGIDRIAAAMGLESATNHFTRMLGPFIGGILFEVFGLQGTLILGAGLYAGAALLLSFVEYAVVPGGGGRPSIFDNIFEGLRFVRGNRVVMATLVITIFWNLFGFSVLSMVPLIAKEELGLTPFSTGILMSAEGGGAFIGALLIAFFASPRRFHQIYFGGASLYLCCIIMFALSSNFWLSLILFWIGGFGLAGFAAMQSALILANSPPEMRNRVMGLLAMCIGTSPIGILCVGLLADQLGAATGVLITSVTGVIAMIGCSLVWPEIRKLRKAIS
jgi:MFS family permease